MLHKVGFIKTCGKNHLASIAEFFEHQIQAPVQSGGILTKVLGHVLLAILDFLHAIRHSS
jgi:hypothetical protein